MLSRVKIDRRAAAAGQNHPARRHRKNDVGAGFYCHTILPDHAYQHFTAGERALAGLTLAPPLDMGCWGGTTQHLGRNVQELGAERPRLGRTWGGSTRGGSTEGRIDRYPAPVATEAVIRPIIYSVHCP